MTDCFFFIVASLYPKGAKQVARCPDRQEVKSHFNQLSHGSKRNHLVSTNLKTLRFGKGTKHRDLLGILVQQHKYIWCRAIMKPNTYTYTTPLGSAWCTCSTSTMNVLIRAGNLFFRRELILFFTWTCQVTHQNRVTRFSVSSCYLLTKLK